MQDKDKALSRGDGSSDAYGDEEMESGGPQAPLPDAQKDVSMQSQSSRSRGRPRQPQCWTRIIDFDHIDDYRIKSFEIEEDLEDDGPEPAPRGRGRRKDWAPLFFSKTCWNDLEEKSLAANVIQKRALKLLAKKAVQARKIILERARGMIEPEAFPLEDANGQISSLSKKQQARGTGIVSKHNEIAPSEYRRAVPIGKRKRSRRDGPLTLSQKTLIVYRVLVEKMAQKDVAKEFRVTQGYISLLCNRCIKKPSLLQDLASEQEVKGRLADAVKEAVTGWVESADTVGSVKQIKQRL